MSDTKTDVITCRHCHDEIASDASRLWQNSAGSFDCDGNPDDCSDCEGSGDLMCDECEGDGCSECEHAGCFGCEECGGTGSVAGEHEPQDV